MNENRRSDSASEFGPPKELAERYGIPTATLKRWRYQGKGPRYIRANGDGRVFYRWADVEAWLKANTVDPSAGAA